MLPAQQLHSSVVHNVLEALPHSPHFHLNALVQLERQHLLVVLPPIGSGHLYLATLGDQIYFGPHPMATAEGQA